MEICSQLLLAGQMLVIAGALDQADHRALWLDSLSTTSELALLAGGSRGWARRDVPAQTRSCPCGGSQAPNGCLCGAFCELAESPLKASYRVEHSRLGSSR